MLCGTKCECKNCLKRATRFTCVTPMLLAPAKTYRLRYRSARGKQSRAPNNPIVVATGRAASRYVLFLEGDNIRNRGKEDDAAVLPL